MNPSGRRDRAVAERIRRPAPRTTGTSPPKTLDENRPPAVCPRLLHDVHDADRRARSTGLEHFEDKRPTE